MELKPNFFVFQDTVNKCIHPIFIGDKIEMYNSGISPIESRLIGEFLADSGCDYNWEMVKLILKFSPKDSEIYRKASQISKKGL